MAGERIDQNQAAPFRRGGSTTPLTSGPQGPRGYSAPVIPGRDGEDGEPGGMGALNGVFPFSGNNGFKADLNAVDQTNIPSTNTPAKILFSTVRLNTGNYYNTTNSKYVPPAGLVFIGAQLLFKSAAGAMVAGDYCQLQFYKNGALQTNPGGIAISTSFGIVSVVNGVFVDLAKGTDYYEIYAAIISSGAGNRAIGGETFNSFVTGFSLTR